MAFNFVNLNEEVRQRMQQELELDINNGKLYLSKRLTNEGLLIYPKLFLKNIIDGNDDTFSIDLYPYIKKQELVNGKIKKVSDTANLTLAEGEFNRFYIRALCLVAIEKGKNLIAYRARTSSSPRPQSERIIGKLFNPKELLNDLRSNPGIDTALGLPPGPNSGISVKLA